MPVPRDCGVPWECVGAWVHGAPDGIPMGRLLGKPWLGSPEAAEVVRERPARKVASAGARGQEDVSDWGGKQNKPILGST